MIALLDVSVLVALFDDGHFEHDAAHDWFSDNVRSGWASCSITENGVIRVLASASYPVGPSPIPNLVMRLGTFCAATNHHFWSDSLTFRDQTMFDVDGIRGHRQLTDVHLLGLAVKNGGRFVTLDQRVPLAAVKNARREHLEIVGGR